MKRLLLLAPQPFFQERGTPIATLAVARSLVGRGYEVDLLTYHEGEDVEVPGCTIHRIRRVPGVSDIPPGFSVKKAVCDAVMAGHAWSLARRRRYDLVHAVEEAVFIAMLLERVFGIPYLYDMDSSLPEQLSDQMPLARAIAPLSDRLERWAIRRSAGVLTMCRSLEEHALTVDPGGLVGRVEDVTILDPPSWDGSGEDLRETIGRDGPIVLYVGNLMPYQGIDLLLEGFARAAASHEDVQLVVIGGSDARRKRYRQMAGRLGIGDRTHFVGPRPVADLGRYLRQATVLVSPRTQGVNTPLKLYSYLDSGVPVVATRLPTHTQVVDEGTAMLTEPSAEDFGDGLSLLLSSPERRYILAARARDLVEREYTPQAFERKLSGFMERVEDSLGWSTLPEPSRPRATA